MVLVFTKFDLVVSKVRFDIAGGNAQHHEHACAKAHSLYEETCRRLFHKDPGGIPAEIVSGTLSLYLPYALKGSTSLRETKIHGSHRQSSRDDRSLHYKLTRIIYTDWYTRGKERSHRSTSCVVSGVTGKS